MGRSYTCKPLALILAIVMIFSLALMASMSTTVFADSDSGNNSSYSTGGGGSSGGSSGSSGNKTVVSGTFNSNKGTVIDLNKIVLGMNYGGIPQKTNTSTTNNDGTLDIDAAMNRLSDEVSIGIEQMKATGGDSVRVKMGLPGVKTLTIGNLNALAQKAVESADGEKVSVVMNIDTMAPDRTVAARVSVDLATAAQNGEDINTSVDVNPNSTVNSAVKDHFQKHYTNGMQTLTFGQQGSFGQTVNAAVKVDLPGDPENITVYSYDVKSNTFTKIDTKITVDKNGYVHFSTPVGGSIVFSDGPVNERPKNEK